VFLDFDGTLSEIVARPELARPAPRTLEVLNSLRDRVQLVAVVSGRPATDLRALIPVPGVQLVGLYGMAEDEGRERIEAVLGAVEAAAAMVPGAWVEDKGASLTVHYRGATDPMRAHALLAPALQQIVDRNRLTLLEGKMVVEVASGPVPGKGAVLKALAGDHRLKGVLYAGDDRPDLDAFAALDQLAAEGRSTVKVAVRTEETPEEVLAAADVVVQRPAGLLELLSEI
jgi:trehalose 6-phosphate phosphatase